MRFFFFVSVINADYTENLPENLNQSRTNAKLMKKFDAIFSPFQTHCDERSLINSKTRPKINYTG